MLMLRSVAGPREGQQLESRQLLVEGVPVLDREDDVVISADMQDRRRGGLEKRENLLGREHRVARCAAQLGDGPLDRNVLAAVGRALSDSLPRGPRRFAAGLGGGLEEDRYLVLEVGRGLRSGVEEQLLGLLDELSG